MSLLFTLFFSFVCIYSNSAFAKPDYYSIFADLKPCFILYDLNKNKVIEAFNIKSCKDRMPPYSTYKIPLSLIGFDSGILKNENEPKWPFKDEYIALTPLQAKDQTPKTWVITSAKWFTQILNEQLGEKKIKEYLSKFDYGKQDYHLNIDILNIDSDHSVLISPEEQIKFLSKMLNYELPIAKDSVSNAQKIFFITKLPTGWHMFGKSASALDRLPEGKKSCKQTSWFVGWLERENQRYIFAINIRDKRKFAEFGGDRVQYIAQQIFSSLDILQ